MQNEFIFILHTLIITASVLIALWLGKSALVAFISMQCLLANIFVIKQITLFGFNATGADPFTIGATLGLNMLQEYFGASITKKAIWINFFLLILYTFLSQIHLAYSPSSADFTHTHFITLFEIAPRILIASLSVYLLVQFLDYYLYRFLKYSFPLVSLVVRNYISIIVCQCIDTILFSFLGLYGVVSNVWHIIFISYSVKLLAIFVATPLISISRRIFVLSHHPLTD